MYLKFHIVTAIIMRFGLLAFSALVSLLQSSSALASPSPQSILPPIVCDELYRCCDFYGLVCILLLLSSIDIEHMLNLQQASSTEISTVLSDTGIVVANSSEIIGIHCHPIPVRKKSSFAFLSSTDRVFDLQVTVDPSTLICYPLCCPREFPVRHLLSW